MGEADDTQKPAGPDAEPGSEDDLATASAARKRAAFHDATTLHAAQHSPMSPRIAPEPATADPEDPSLETADRGNYDVYGEIARGGLGRILRARDKRLDREVAIKELHFRLGNVEARFAREMRLTARLQHPSIVPIYEAGRWPSGEPFYAMKLVEGRSLADVAAEATTLEERLRLLPNVIDVAEAIAYAHSEHILHRDLKPANVLVGSFGETVVIDWGLAKDLDHPVPEDAGPQPDDRPDDILDASSSPFNTGSGAVIGTPAFMPPEQARGEIVDERADVYSLGALLYHVLGGVRPYDGVARAQILERVMTASPEPLSQIAPDIPNDLVAIIEKAMARDVADRYPSAADLVEDLQRFSAGKLVGSYEYTLPELVARFVSRQKAAVVTATLGAAALALLGIFSFNSIAEERDQAEASAAEATRARDLEASALRLAEDRIDLLNLEKATSLLDVDPTGAVAWLKEVHGALPGAPTVAIDAADRGVAQRILLGHTDRVWTGSFSPDGRLLATGSSDRTARVWTLETGAATELAEHRDRVVAVSFAPDGARLATAGYDGRVCIFDVVGPHSECEQAHRRAVKDVAWSPDGRVLASVGADNTIRVHRLGDDAPGATLRAKSDRFGRVSFTPDGTRLVSGGHDGALFVFSATTHERLMTLTGHEGPLAHFDVSPDGSEVATAGEDGTVRVWSLATGQGRLVGMHAAEASVVAFDPEGRRLASSGLDRRVVVWDLAGGAPLVFEGHGERVAQLAFSADGRTLASGSWDRTVRLWELSSGQYQTLRGHGDVISWVGFSPDGRVLASASWNGEVRVWPVTPSPSRILGRHDIGVHTVATSPDGIHAASGGHDDTVRLWTLEDGAMRVLGRHDDHVFRVRFSPDGAWVASSSDDQTVRLFATRGRESHVLRGHGADVEEIAFSPDGLFLASAGEDDRVFLWSMASYTGIPLEGHSQPVTAVVFSPDGSLLASASRDRTVRIWSMPDGTQLRRLSNHALDVWGIAFSPDGDELASAGLDDRVLVWDVATGEHTVISGGLAGARLLAYSPNGTHLAVSSSGQHLWICEIAARECDALDGHGTTVTSLFFAQNALVTTSGDGTMRVWDVATGESRVYRGHDAAVFEAGITPDGAQLVTGSGDTTVRVWSFGLPPHPRDLPRLLADLTDARVVEVSPRGGDRTRFVR